MTCPACARLDKARRGEDHFFIAEMRESFALLHKHQAYEGWCSLFLKEHQEHLEALAPERQIRLWQDVMDVSAAVRRAFSPRRLNIECLGNVVPHVHWHVIPRYGAPVDPEPGSTVWTRSDAELNCGVETGRIARLIAQLRDAGLRGPQ